MSDKSFSLQPSDHKPAFINAEMWMCFDVGDDDQSTGDGKLVRPKDGACRIVSAGEGPLCYLNVASGNGENDLIILLAPYAVSVCRASDFAVLGHFPASGERVVV